MIKRFIRNIRQKPKAVRNNIALGIAVIFTGAVTTVWLVHLPDKIDQLNMRNNKSEESSFASLFTVFKEEFSEVRQTASTSTADDPVLPKENSPTTIPRFATSSRSTTMASTTKSFTASTSEPGGFEQGTTTRSSTSQPARIRIVPTATVATTAASSTQ